MFDIGKHDQILRTKIYHIFGRDLVEKLECFLVDPHLIVDTEEFEINF